MYGISSLQRYELRSAMVKVALLTRSGKTASTGIVALTVRSLKKSPFHM